MKRALRGVRAMVKSGSSLEIARKTDSSEVELENLVEQPTEQKTSSGAIQLNVQGESSGSIS